MCNFDTFFEIIKNLKIEDIKNINCQDSIKNDIATGSDFSNYKLFINKTDKFKLPRMDLDLLFGLYSEDDDCEYKIFYDNTVIKEGIALKNKITYIPPLPLICTPYNDVFISVSGNTFLLCSVFAYHIRKKLAIESHKIPKFIFEGGFIKYEKNQTESCFPILENNSIEDRINNLDKTNDYLKKYDLLLTDDDAKKISCNIHLLNMFIDKKMLNL